MYANSVAWVTSVREDAQTRFSRIKKHKNYESDLSHFDSQHGAYVFVNDVAYADGWSDLWGMRMSRVKKSVIRITSFEELLNLEYNDGKTMK